MNSDKITIRVKKIYINEVRYINSILVKEANAGFAFKDKNRVDFTNKQ